MKNREIEKQRNRVTEKQKTDHRTDRKTNTETSSQKDTKEKNRPTNKELEKIGRAKTKERYYLYYRNTTSYTNNFFSSLTNARICNKIVIFYAEAQNKKITQKDHSES